MQVEITVNRTKIQARKGETILTALQRNGIKIPTLCNLPELTPTGACRLCVVEDEDTRHLIPACSTPVQTGMKILTHSPKVIRSRQTIIDLLLTNHPDDCLYCDKNRRCELQSLSEELYIRERLFTGVKKKGKTDRSSQGLVFDMSKCILCGRCVKVCSEIIGVAAIDHVYRGKRSVVDTVLGKGLYYSSCIQCGQCINICPTGALREKSAIEQIAAKIGQESVKISVILSASSVASIAAVFGIRKFEEMTEMLVAALKDTGFSTIVTDSFASDLYFADATSLICDRIVQPDFKMVISDCPAAIQWVKQKHPEFAHFLVPLRSPQQITGRMLKRETNGSNNIVVAVMPCIARKTEALQPNNLTRGLPDIDFVVTTHELLHLLRTRGVTMPFPKRCTVDKPYNIYSSCSVLHEYNGGFAESLVRNLLSTEGKNSLDSKYTELRVNKPVKTFETSISGRNLKLVSLNGMQAINEYFLKYVTDNSVHIIEISSCVGGCINGSSQLDSEASISGKVLLDFESSGLLRNSVQNAIVKGMSSDNVVKPITRYESNSEL